MKDFSKHVKIRIPLERDADGYPPADNEYLWAEPIGGAYKIDNIPFFALGISLGDVVEAKTIDDDLLFARVLDSSNHSTVRIVIFDMDHAEMIVEHLAGYGCAVENSHIPGLVAIDIPPSANIAGVRDYLHRGEESEIFEYEEASVMW